jgi:glycosyltransferase involved in cell wall biosynthesis
MRVLFVNDIGFQYGAGAAHLRQIQSFLRAGHEVAAFCCCQGAEEERAAFTAGPPPRWLGLREFPELYWDRAPSAAQIIDEIVGAARSLQPDLVVVGNLHGARWPLALIGALRDSGLRVVVFMHDGYYVSGRCAYAGDCRLFETGCDHTCPTADEYPVLAPNLIAGAWQERRRILCGTPGVPLAVNSRWTLDLARRGLSGLPHSDVVYYGLDERVFHPLDQALCRRLLQVPADRFVVVAGAVNFDDQRKGGRVLRRVIDALGSRVHFLLFGHAPLVADSVQSTGFLRDLRRMPFVYGAADLFLGTSIEEAFGQTYCEASACGLPIAALRAGGVPEIARDGLNARLVEPDDPEALIAVVETLMADRDARETLGRAGRALVEEEFTLDAQAARWAKFLDACPAS